MIFTDTPLAGAFVLELEFLHDVRGSFARVFCTRELRVRGLCGRFVQCNVSFNRLRATLRGLHYQEPPHAETKIVRCTRGAIWDVILDLRADSRTFGQWFGLELSADNYRSLYVPEGFAHGFQTLVDGTEVFYQHSAYYSAPHARGIRWNDPAFRIEWPLEPTVMSDKDRAWPDHPLVAAEE